MNNFYTRLAIGFILFGLIILLVMRLNTGLRIIIDPKSEIKEDIKVTILGKKRSVNRTAPSRVSLAPGSYVVIANSPNSLPWQEKVRVNFGRVSAVNITLYQSPDNEIADQETNPSFESSPYLKILPHFDELFEAQGIYEQKNGTVELTKIIITLNLSLTSIEPEEIKNLERERAIAAAKQWLVDNNIPDSIVIEFK